MIAVMNGSSAGRHPLTREFVKTIRSRLSMARKQPLMCDVNSPPSSLIWVRNEPPGRRSISRILHVAGAGTHHCSNLARSVQALQTTGRGALITRDIVRSRSGCADEFILIFPFHGLW